MRRPIQRAVAILACLIATGCPPTTSGTSSTVPQAVLGPALPIPEEVTAGNLALAMRRLEDLDGVHDMKAGLRTAVVHELSLEFEAASLAGDPGEADRIFRMALSTYSSEEILAGGVSPEVASMARKVADAYSPLGDEVRVMTALIVLGQVSPGDQAIAQEYGTLVEWAEESREGFPDEAMKVIDLVNLYEQVADAVPVPAIADRLIALYVERQDLSRAAYKKMIEFDPAKGLSGLKEAAFATQLYEYLQPQVRRTSYLVTRLFARAGTPTAALAVLEADFSAVSPSSMQGQVHEEVVAVLEAIEGDPDAPEGWLALSRMLSKNEDLGLARWAARMGWRTAPEEAVFPFELGRLYRLAGDGEGAEEYLALASSMDDDNPAIMEEMIGLYSEEADAAIGAHDLAAGKAAIAKLEPIVAKHIEAWPARKAAAGPADVARMEGALAFLEGKPVEAIAAFEEALEMGPEPTSLLFIAEIGLLTGDYEGAREAAGKAIKAPAKKDGAKSYWKMIASTIIGDAFRLEGREDEAKEAWKRALSLGKEGLPYVPPPLKPQIEARIGLVHHRLGDPDKAVEHLKRAIASGAGREVYEMVLVHLVARGDVEITDAFYHFAATDSSLDGDVRRQFAAWKVGLHWRAGIEPDAAAIDLLRAATTSQWPGPLMGYAAGSISSGEVEQAAAGDPARLAALRWLVACKLVGKGEGAEASKALRGIVETGLVADPHYAMAVELLHEIGSAK